MKFFDEDGKVTGSAMWISALFLMIINGFIWIAFSNYGHMTQGMFAALANAIVGLYALQFPKYFRRLWFWIAISSLILFYLIIAFLMPSGLPKDTPTSLFLWPFALATIGIDFIIIRIFSIFSEFPRVYFY